MTGNDSRPDDDLPAAGANPGENSSNFSARQLIDLYSELGQEIDEHAGPNDPLAAVTAVAVQTLPGVVHASITRRRENQYQTFAPNDSVASAVDLLQYELNTGPCVDCIRSDTPLHAADLASDPRWPEFGPLAAQQFGISSMLSSRLVLDDDIHASLNLYSDVIDGFPARSHTLAMLLTTHGVVALGRVVARERAFNLESALANSRRIGIATGVLMAAQKLTSDDAFTLMRIVGQNSNRRMRFVAEEVIETGTLNIYGPS